MILRNHDKKLTWTSENAKRPSHPHQTRQNGGLHSSWMAQRSRSTRTPNFWVCISIVLYHSDTTPTMSPKKPREDATSSLPLRTNNGVGKRSPWGRYTSQPRGTFSTMPPRPGRLSFRFGIFHIERNMSDLKPPKHIPILAWNTQGVPICIGANCCKFQHLKFAR